MTLHRPYSYMVADLLVTLALLADEKFKFLLCNKTKGAN